MTKKFIPAVGESDFRELRRAKSGFVDKSYFIRDLLEDNTKVLCFPRPRRFGKSTNLSMLGYFLRKSNEDLHDIFEGLEVTRHPETMRHFQKYPVIFITLKDAKSKTYTDTLADIGKRIETICREHWETMTMPEGLGRTDRLRRCLSGTATESDLTSSLKDLSDALYEYHKERVVILIDEYDTPMHAGYTHKYFNKITAFLRTFLSRCLKDNSALFKGVMTGILRVARENMFSDLNHIMVHSILDEAYATCFGFTESEVQEIIEPERFEEVRNWYNGYIFGGNVIYNPWSILNYIKRGKLEPYWVNTGGTHLIETLALKHGMALSFQSTALLNGETIAARVDPHIALRAIADDPESFWNFLFFCGYLKPVHLELIDGEYHAKLAIPNQEVKVVYRKLFDDWLRRCDPGYGYTNKFVKALMTGDAATAQDMLQRILLTALSVYDTKQKHPEKLYHGFVVGMLVHLEGQYEVRSNQETIFGRADATIRPKQSGKPGVVMEFKTLDPREEVEHALLEGAEQIREKHYATQLLAAGVSMVYEYTMAFDGKMTWVKRVEDVWKG